MVAYVRKAILSTIAGAAAGLAAVVFLILLEWATQTRNSHQNLILLLPLAGLLSGWIYHQLGQDVSRGHNLILDEIHDPRRVVPLRMAPLVLSGTILTHLFGGSAGREGTAVQMGASLADQLTKFFRVQAAERASLLMAGMAAGFAASIGTPWAGMIFGLEVSSVGRLKYSAWLECFIASFVGYCISILLKAPHSIFSRISVAPFNFKTVFCVAVAGVIFGLAALLFINLTRAIELGFSKLVRYPPLRPMVAGIVLVLLYWIEGSYRFVGLGIEVIQTAFETVTSFNVPVLKSIFTAFTVGSGFKGGEFIPLVFIGTTLGSALSLIFPVAVKLLAAVGFVAVFAGASNTPLACTVMAVEIFGIDIGIYAFIGCFASYYASGQSTLYKSQRLHGTK